MFPAQIPPALASLLCKVDSILAFSTVPFLRHRRLMTQVVGEHMQLNGAKGELVMQKSKVRYVPWRSRTLGPHSCSWLSDDSVPARYVRDRLVGLVNRVAVGR